MLYPCSNAHGDNMDTHVGQCLLDQNGHAIQHHIYVCLFLSIVFQVANHNCTDLWGVIFCMHMFINVK